MLGRELWLQEATLAHPPKKQKIKQCLKGIFGDGVPLHLCEEHGPKRLWNGLESR